MLVRIDHPALGPAKTRLGADLAAAAASSTVENYDGFAADKYIVFGKPGEELAEIVLLTSVTANVTLGHTTGPVFAHSKREPVSLIKFNQGEVWRATAEGGTYALIATVDLDINELLTIYDDADGSTASWYKTRYKDEKNTEYSPYSDEVQGTGYTEESLRSMTNEVLDDFGDPDAKEITRKKVRRLLRGGVRKTTIEMIKTFPDYRRQQTTEDLVATTYLYDLPTRFLAFNRIDLNFSGTVQTDAVKVERFENESEGEPDTTYNTSAPRIFRRADQWGIRPTPTATGKAWLYYWDYPEVMTEEADEHGLPYGAREALIEYALYRLWLPKDTKKAAIYKSDWRASLGSYIEFVATRWQTQSPQRVRVTFGQDMYE